MKIFDIIKQQLQIFDVVSEQVTLKRAGNYFKGCCPFHHEKTASFTVSPDKGIFYCFGCHQGGDVISFTAKIEQCNQLEAAKLLAERYQLDIPQDAQSTLHTGNIDQKRSYYAICALVAEWCQQELHKAPAVQRYLIERGIDKQCITYFSLGYFPVGQRAITSLLSFMGKHNLLADDLIEAQIISKGRTALYSPFEDRIIFPIKNHLGHYCGFGGRVFKKNDSRAKYYNSRENSFFNKGALLYGFDLAKEHMQKEGSLFLVEGYTDCIAMVQHGYKNTVATLGTACTIDHLRQIARYIDHVTVLYDGDVAGQQAILRLTELCWQVDLDIKIIPLPKGEDPASWLTKKDTDMPQMIRNAQDVFCFFIDQVSSNFSQKPLNQKLQVARRIIDIIGRLDEPLKQDILLQHAAQALSMPYDSLKQEMLRSQTPTIPREPESVPDEPATENHPPEAVNELPKLEKKLFCGIINNTAFIGHRFIDNIVRCLPAPYADILTKWITLANQQPEHAFRLLFEQLNEYEKNLVGSILIIDNEPMKAEEFDHLVYQLQKKHWKRVVHDIKIRLEVAKKTNNSEQMQRLLHDFSLLKNRIVQLNKSPVSKEDA